MTGLTWLHISDWHQKGEDFDRKVVRDALLKDIRDRKEGISPDLEFVDFVVFSGDVAHAARETEYKAAVEHLLDPVLEATGLGPDRLFITPGAP